MTVTTDLFEIAKEPFGELWDDENITFEVPILPDRYGLTPIDLCLGIRRLVDS